MPGRGAVQARVAATNAAAVRMPKPSASRTDGTPPNVRRSWPERASRMAATNATAIAAEQRGDDREERGGGRGARGRRRRGDVAGRRGSRGGRWCAAGGGSGRPRRTRRCRGRTRRAGAEALVPAVGGAENAPVPAVGGAENAPVRSRGGGGGRPRAPSGRPARELTGRRRAGGGGRRGWAGSAAGRRRAPARGQSRRSTVGRRTRDPVPLRRSGGEGRRSAARSDPPNPSRAGP